MVVPGGDYILHCIPEKAATTATKKGKKKLVGVPTTPSSGTVAHSNQLSKASSIARESAATSVVSFTTTTTLYTRRVFLSPAESFGSRLARKMSQWRYEIGGRE